MREVVEERCILSVDAVSMRQHRFLGVADCAMLSLVDGDAVLLTTE